MMKSISSALATQYPETLGEFSFGDIRTENLYQMWRCELAQINIRRARVTNAAPFVALEMFGGKVTGVSQPFRNVHATWYSQLHSGS